MSGIYQAKAASPRLLPDRSGVYLALTLRMRRFFCLPSAGKSCLKWKSPVRYVAASINQLSIVLGPHAS